MPAFARPPRSIALLLLIVLCLPLHAETTAQLLRQLSDGDPATKVTAIQTLGRQRAREAVEPLVVLTRDPSPTLRGQAATALGLIGDTKATPAVMRLLRDPFILVRAAAVAAAGKLKDRAATPVLLEVLRDPASGIQAAAIEALGLLGDPQAVPDLLKLLDSPAPEVRAAAITALSALHDPRAAEAFLPGLQRVEPEMRLAAARALIPLRYPSARAPLLAALTDDNAEVRAAAAQALGTYRDPQNAGGLLAALNEEEDITVRTACLQALLPLRDPRLADPCLQILDDAPYNDDTKLNMAAIEAVGRLRAAKAVPLLLPLLSERGRRNRRDEEDRSDACIELTYAALRRIGTPALIALLAEMHPDVERERRLNAIRALGRWQSSRTVTPLLALLDDADPAVQHAAVEALVIQHGNETYYPLIERMSPPHEPIAIWTSWLAPRAWCRDPRLVDWLVVRTERGEGELSNLGRMGTPRALDAVLNELRNPNRNRSQQAVQFLQFFEEPRAADALLAYITMNRANARDARRLLALCKAPLPQAPLVAMLKDKDPEMRKSAAAAMGLQRDARAAPELLKIVGVDPVPEVREYCALALGMIGDARALPALTNRLNDPMEWVRSAAAWALGQIGDPRAIAVLKKKAGGADPRTAVRLGRALAQLGDPLGAEMMATALQSPDEMVRRVAAQTIHAVPAAQRIPLLLAMLDSADTTVRYQVLPAFRRIDDPAAVEALIPLLQESRAGAYTGVTHALGQTGAAQARAPLAACLDHADEVLANTAAIALVRLGDARGLPQVLEILADPVYSQRMEALLALGDGPPLFASESEAAQPLLAALGILLADPDPLIGALAARALGQYGDPRGTDFLLAQLKTEDDPAVLLFTIPYLSALRDARAVPLLQARLPKLAFAVKLKAVEALGVIGDSAALPMLANLSRHLDPRIREATARGLAGQGAGGRHLLTPLLHDEASRVAKVARESLARIDAK
jgi:HEAT repeat protein